MPDIEHTANHNQASDSSRSTPMLHQSIEASARFFLYETRFADRRTDEDSLCTRSSFALSSLAQQPSSAFGSSFFLLELASPQSHNVHRREGQTDDNAIFTPGRGKIGRHSEYLAESIERICRIVILDIGIEVGHRIPNGRERERVWSHGRASSLSWKEARCGHMRV